MRLLYDAALKSLAAEHSQRRLRAAMQAAFSRDEFAQLLYELFRLYAEEARCLSRSVRLPRLLTPLRELIAQEMLNVMLKVARPLALEIAATALRPATAKTGPSPNAEP
jgi:MoxR-like ATPase